MGAGRTECVQPRHTQLLSNLPEPARGIEGWISCQCRRILGAISGRQFVVQYLWTKRANSGRGWPQRVGVDQAGDQHQVQSFRRIYNKFGVQVASSPDGPFAEKSANPSGLE